ncbi:Amidase signature domain-containing protein [Mycena kentingensis (nom. inval.)]|nr:Amidase signature domain-containing protein [Mycena kentingensis (nom. inval.)]
MRAPRTRALVRKEGFISKFMDASVAKRVREATSKLAAFGAIVEEVSIPLHLAAGNISHVLNKFRSAQTRQGGLNANEFWNPLDAGEDGESWDLSVQYRDVRRVWMGSLSGSSLAA